LKFSRIFEQLICTDCVYLLRENVDIRKNTETALDRRKYFGAEK